MPAYASAFSQPRPPVAIVGAGAVGRALALRLSGRGYPVAAVLSRTKASAQRLADAVGAPVASNDLSDLPDGVELVLLCAGDSALKGLAEDLAYTRFPWRGVAVAHVSGALPAALLQPLKDAGAVTFAFHPLQTLTRDSGENVLDGVYVGVEGDPRGVAAGVELAVGLDLRYLVLDADSKARYHLAASMASNFFVTLMGMVQETMGSLGIGRAEAHQIIRPLVQGTLDNMAALPPEDALTGPIVRGDVDTLRQHGLALRRHLPQLVPAYAALAVETVRLAVRSGRLDPAEAEGLLGLLQQLVTIPIPKQPEPARGDREGGSPRPDRAPVAGG